MSKLESYLGPQEWDGLLLDIHERILCADGFSVSVQANRCAYCRPRDDNGPYFEVELGFPSERPTDAIMQFAEEAERPTETVYGYVPVALVRELIALHGGEAA